MTGVQGDLRPGGADLPCLAPDVMGAVPREPRASLVEPLRRRAGHLSCGEALADASPPSGSDGLASKGAKGRLTAPASSADLIMASSSSSRRGRTERARRGRVTEQALLEVWLGREEREREALVEYFLQANPAWRGAGCTTRPTGLLAARVSRRAGLPGGIGSSPHHWRCHPSRRPWRRRVWVGSPTWNRSRTRILVANLPGATALTVPQKG